EEPMLFPNRLFSSIPWSNQCKFKKMKRLATGATG
ncbi:hypothetical protein D046_3947B, partial [Vibrio parahaemolyticus V-223/04]